mmetsp:Transcript_120509/g.257303  ORF Transcript_120509/g.257303 Transcript_120509/m.257303 type:complete len:257 (-) Transcript_120509:23-793(-)
MKQAHTHVGSQSFNFVDGALSQSSFIFSDTSWRELMKSHLFSAGFSSCSIAVQLFGLLLPIMVALMFGTLLGVLVEDMSFLDSVYMAIITVSTCGFGDFSPKTTTGRLIACVYLPLSVAAVALSVQDISLFVAMSWHMNRARNIPQILEEAHAKELKEHEFQMHIVSTLYGVDEAILKASQRLFQQLDIRKSGVLRRDATADGEDSEPGGIASGGLFTEGASAGDPNNTGYDCMSDSWANAIEVNLKIGHLGQPQG